MTTAAGPLLIIAGPASGKTFTLVERIVFLLTEKGVTPEQIMVVTFSDKAAQLCGTRTRTLPPLADHRPLRRLYYTA
jgi:ATP-dependent DNA helicase UvrD/PcrA